MPQEKQEDPSPVLQLEEKKREPDAEQEQQEPQIQLEISHEPAGENQGEEVQQEYYNYYYYPLAPPPPPIVWEENPASPPHFDLDDSDFQLKPEDFPVHQGQFSDDAKGVTFKDVTVKNPGYMAPAAKDMERMEHRMKTVEYRIVMPLTLEEYERAQLWVLQVRHLDNKSCHL